MPQGHFEQQFESLAQAMPELAGHDAQWSLEFRAEASDFVRLNLGAIRQPGHVRRTLATIRLLEGRRHASRVVALSGEEAEDQNRLAQAVAGLRSGLPSLAEDPLCQIETAPSRSRRVERMASLDGAQGVAQDSRPGDAARAIIEQVVSQTRGLDFVGILAAGPRARGLTNSHGVHHWHEVDGYSFDFSLHHDQGELRGRAAKASMHGRTWQADTFAKRLEQLRQDHALLARPARASPTGNVRAFLMPAAVEALLGLMSWGGFSASDRMARRSPLQRLVDGEVRLSDQISIWDDVRASDASGFNAEGFRRVTPLSLIEQGRDAGACCNPRTSIEYGVAHTGADGEQPEALMMAAGEIETQEAMRALGTGLFVNRLWYLNWSDRQSARMTGMTRFATWWVENGEAVGPVDPMRFDDSIYRTFGDALEGLTTGRDMIGDDSTYDERSLKTALVPGALLSSWRLVS